MSLFYTKSLLLQPLVVAIDGPGGSGKTTIGRILAKRLNLGFLNSGSLYRAITWYISAKGLTLRELLETIQLSINKNGTIRINEILLTESQLHTLEVETKIKEIADNLEVRHYITQFLRDFIKKENRVGYVVEGRDITTEVFSETPLKFFLDASLEERVKRRWQQRRNKEKGEDILNKLKLRDMDDRRRPRGTLKIAPDAHYIDTTKLSIKEVINIIEDKVKEYLKRDGNNFWYHLLHCIFWLFFKFIFFLKVEGHENIPPFGTGCIIAANHYSYLDPPLLGTAIIRKPRYLAKAELFKYSFFAYIIRLLGAIPIKRHSLDKAILEKIEDLIKKGHLVIIFPEGRRHLPEEKVPPYGGIGLLIYNLGKIPVIPAKIEGTDIAWGRNSRFIKPFVKLSVKFGSPLDLGKFREYPPTPQNYRAISEFILRAIYSL